MDNARDEAINKLIVGQEEMRKDISGLKTDVSDLKKDVSDLKRGQQKLEVDVSDLKHGQSALEKMMFKMMEEMTFVKEVVVKMENDLNPRVKSLFDADKSRQHETTDLKQTCREQEEKLKDHEIRISRLEED